MDALKAYIDVLEASMELLKASMEVLMFSWEIQPTSMKKASDVEDRVGHADDFRPSVYEGNTMSRPSERVPLVYLVLLFRV